MAAELVVQILAAIVFIVAAIIALIPCPLANCDEEHPLLRARNKKATPYLRCDSTWGGSLVWFRTPVASEFLEANNGGVENLALPVHSARRELPRVAKRARRVNPEDHPEDQIPDVIDTDDIETDDSGVALGHCSGCGEPLGEHQIGQPCPGCGQPVERVIDAPAASNPSGISNLEADSIAGRCDGCGASLTYGDLNKQVCPSCNEPLTGVRDE